MSILKLLGGLLLTVLALMLSLGAFVLCARARVDFRAKNGETTLYVGLGPVRVRCYPPPKQLRARARKKEPPAAPRAPQAGKLSMDNVDTGDLLCLLFDLLGQMKQKLILETVWAEVVIGTGDAARTGLLYGYCAAIAGMVLPFLEQNFNMETCHIAVDGDFDVSSTRWNVKLTLAVRPGSLLLVLLKNRRRLLEMYQLMVKKEGAKTYERTSN